jgi:hypothetical protein
MAPAHLGGEVGVVQEAKLRHTPQTAQGLGVSRLGLPMKETGTGLELTNEVVHRFLLESGLAPLPSGPWISNGQDRLTISAG